MTALVALLTLCAQHSIHVGYSSGHGLTVKWQGLTVIDGSGFQYYEPGWTKGYYSSHWTSQQVTGDGVGGFKVDFKSSNGLADGTVHVSPEGSSFAVDYVFRWHGDHPILIENGVGVVRKPFFSSLFSDRNASTPLRAAKGASLVDGTLKVGFQGPLFRATVDNDAPMSVLDGEAVDEDWNQSGPSVWVGNTAIEIKPGEEVRRHVRWQFELNDSSVGPDVTLNAAWNKDVISHREPVALPPSRKSKIAWRGIHLFVGPAALQFQERLIKNVLKPLGFNHVVLQCERTAWDATPGIATPLTMSKSDLARLFALYRRNGIEPIPLIQSFGHMEWLFANGKNRALAYNPAQPYAIDPRKPEARNLVAKIWEEAIALLHPKTIHFGLDEVDLVGFPDNDAKTVTELWKLQVPFLLELARSHNVQPMLWGDKMLAPGEAPDACLGDNAVEARARKEALTGKVWIADWHYKADTARSVYRSLALYKGLGMEPVAAEWFRLENIAGFTKAAELNNSGTLLTTWAGYESNERNMLANPKQFAAIAFAAIANSDPNQALKLLRSNGVSAVEDQCRSQIQRMYFEEGHYHSSNATTVDVSLQGIVAPQRGRSLAITTTPMPADAIEITAGCEDTAMEGELVGQIEAQFSDGTRVFQDIVYGLDVTSAHGPSTFRSAAGATRLSTNGKELVAVRVHESGPYGLFVRKVRILTKKP